MELENDLFVLETELDDGLRQEGSLTVDEAFLNSNLLCQKLIGSRECVEQSEQNGCFSRLYVGDNEALSSFLKSVSESVGKVVKRGGVLDAYSVGLQQIGPISKGNSLDLLGQGKTQHGLSNKSNGEMQTRAKECPIFVIELFGPGFEKRAP